MGSRGLGIGSMPHVPKYVQAKKAIGKETIVLQGYLLLASLWLEQDDEMEAEKGYRRL